MVRLLFLSLRNLLGASGVVLLLLSGLRLYLFLRRVLRALSHTERLRSGKETRTLTWPGLSENLSL